MYRRTPGSVNHRCRIKYPVFCLRPSRLSSSSFASIRDFSAHSLCFWSRLLTTPSLGKRSSETVLRNSSMLRSVSDSDSTISNACPFLGVQHVRDKVRAIMGEALTALVNQQKDRLNRRKQPSRNKQGLYCRSACHYDSARPSPTRRMHRWLEPSPHVSCKFCYSNIAHREEIEARHLQCRSICGCKGRSSTV